MVEPGGKLDGVTPGYVAPGRVGVGSAGGVPGRPEGRVRVGAGFGAAGSGSSSGSSGSSASGLEPGAGREDGLALAVRPEGVVGAAPPIISVCTRAPDGSPSSM